MSSKVRLLLAWSLRDLIKEVDKKTPIFLLITEILRKLLRAILAFSLGVTLIQGNIWIALLINFLLYFFSSSLALMFLLCLIRLNVLIAVWNLNFSFVVNFFPPHCSTNNRHHLEIWVGGCNLSFLTHILAWNEGEENVRYLKLFFKGDGMFQPCMALRPNSLVCLWWQERHSPHKLQFLSLFLSLSLLLCPVFLCVRLLCSHM